MGNNWAALWHLGTNILYAGNKLLKKKLRHVD